MTKIGPWLMYMRRLNGKTKSEPHTNMIWATDGYTTSVSWAGSNLHRGAHMQIPLDMKAVCLTGHGHPVAEDCGGPDGWEDLKELFEKPRMKDEDGTREWYKKQCFNGDSKGLNAHEFDMLKVNDDLSKIPL